MKVFAKTFCQHTLNRHLTILDDILTICECFYWTQVYLVFDIWVWAYARPSKTIRKLNKDAKIAC